MSNHESTIVKPRDPSLTNSDDWPVFVIDNALVFDPLDPTTSPANLLHAGVYRPLSISGKFDTHADVPAELLLRPTYPRNQPIEIANVTQFSYGQYEDGTVDIWASGQAGWYTINPSRPYKHVYEDMVQAVKLLYFTSDTYQAAKKLLDVDAQLLFLKYCLDHADTCKTVDDAEDLFTYHRYFLFASMLDGKEGLQWTRTPFFKYLEATFPDDTSLIKQRRAFAMKPPKSTSSKRSTQSPAPSNASLKRKRKEKLQALSTAEAPVSRSKSRSASVATTASSITGSQMLATRSQPKRGSTKSSTQQQISAPFTKENSSSDADSEDSTEEPRAHKGKSSLRPKPAKYIHNSQQGTTLGDGDDADDDETDEPQGPSQTSPSSSSKRKMTGNDPRSRRAKRRESHMHVEDPDQVMLEDTNDETEDTVATPSDGYHDAKESMVEENKPVLAFRFRDGRAGEDNGDVWRCSSVGCMHKVYAASEPASQILIDDHQRMHEHDDDQRVQLVRRMEAPWLPIGRLMGRVRELAAQSGTPAPIVQRYA
ncbi:hypothetical protein BDV97DRAFT_401409 [Delphinella strobiligena]|nr:hypothetical protein BDV97DRAFT_401409 [Delphinella strobiligena]